MMFGGSGSLGSVTGYVDLNIDGINAGIDGAMAGFEQLDRAGSSGLTGWAQGIKANERQLQSWGRGFTAVGAIATAAFGGMVASASSFEQKMSNVEALSGASSSEMAMLEERALSLASSTKYTAGEVSDAMGFLAMAGFDVQEIYGTLPGVLNLAAAANLDLARTADLSTNIMRAFGIESEKMVDVADILTHTFTNSNTSMEQLADAMKYVAPVAANAGISLEEVAAAVGMLGDNGIQGSMAGTVLRGAITKLIAPTQQAQKILDRLGISTTDATGQMLPLYDILGQFPPVTTKSFNAMQDLYRTVEANGIAMENLDGSARPIPDILADLEAAGIDTSDMMGLLSTEAGVVGDIMSIFGLRAGPGMLALLSMGSDGLKEFTEEIRGAGGAAERVAQTQLRNLRGALNLFRAAWESITVKALGSGPLQLMRYFVLGLKGVLDVLYMVPAPVLAAGASLLGIAGVLTTLTGVTMLALPRIATFVLNLNQMAMAGGRLGGLATATLRLGDAIFRLAGFARMLAPIIGPLFGAGLLAYKANALGFGDWIDSQVSKATRAWQSFKSMFGASVNETLTETRFTTGSLFDGSIFGEAGSGADGKDWFVLGPDGERFGQILESYNEAGTIHMRVDMGDGTEQWLEQGPDGITKWADGVETSTSVQKRALGPMERFNDGMDQIQANLLGSGWGFLNPIVGGFQSLVNVGARGIGGLKNLGNWLSNFNDTFLNTWRRMGGMDLGHDVFRISDALSSAWRSWRPSAGFLRDIGDALFTNRDAERMLIPVAERITAALGVALDRVGLGHLRGFAASIVNGVGDAFGYIRGLADTVGGAISAGFGVATDFIQGFGQALAGIWSFDGFSFIEKLGYSLANAFGNAGFGGVARTIARVTSNVGTFIDAFRLAWEFGDVSAGSIGATRQLGFIERGLTSLSAALRIVGLDSFADKVDVLNEKYGEMRVRVLDLASDIRNGFGRAVDFVQEAIEGIPGAFERFVSGPIGRFIDRFRSGGAGAAFGPVIDGLRDLGSAAWDASTSFASSAFDTASGWLRDIGSSALDAAQGLASMAINLIPDISIDFGAINDAITRGVGRAFEFTLSAGLRIIDWILEDPTENLKKTVLAAIIPALAILTATGGITAVLALAGIVGMAALGLNVIKRVVDYFASDPEARARIRLQISEIYAKLEDIPLVGPLFKLGRLMYDYVYKPLWDAAFWIRDWASTSESVFAGFVNSIIDTFGGIWMALAGLNLLERFGASAVLGRYSKQVGDARVAVSGLEAAMYGLFKVAKLPFKLVFQPLDLLKQIVGGTNGRQMNAAMGEMVSTLTRSGWSFEDASKAARRFFRDTRFLQGFAGNTTKNFRTLNLVGQGFLASFRMIGAVVASLFSPFRTLGVIFRNVASAISQVMAQYGNLTSIMTRSGGLTLRGAAISTQELARLADIYRDVVRTAGRFNIDDAFGTGRVFQGATSLSDLNFDKALRDEYSKIFRFLERNGGEIARIRGGIFNPKTWALLVVSAQRALSNSLARRGGIASLIGRFFFAPIELPARALNAMFDIEGWMKRGMTATAGQRRAGLIANWFRTAMGVDGAIDMIAKGDHIEAAFRGVRRNMLDEAIRATFRGGATTPEAIKAADELFTSIRRVFDQDMRASWLRVMPESGHFVEHVMAEIGDDWDKMSPESRRRMQISINRHFGGITDDMFRAQRTGLQRLVGETGPLFIRFFDHMFGWLVRGASSFAQRVGGVFSRLFSGVGGGGRVAGGLLASIGGAFNRAINSLFTIDMVAMSRFLDDQLVATLARLDTDVFQGLGKIHQRAIENIILGADYNRPVAEMVGEINQSIGNLRGISTVDKAATTRIVDEMLGSINESAFRRRLNLMDVLFGDSSIISRTIRGITAPFRFLGTQVGNIGRNFESVARIWGRVMPFFGQGAEILDEFGKVVGRSASWGSRFAVAAVAAAGATALWNLNLFGTRDAFGGVAERIGMGISAITRAWGEGGMAGVINAVIDGVQQLASDIPGALAMIANSPAWDWLFSAFGILGGMFIGGPLGLGIALLAPLMAKAAKGMVSSIGRIASAWDKNGLDGAMKQFGREVSNALGGAGRWLQGFGRQMIDVGNALGRIPVIGRPLQSFFTAIGNGARTLGFRLLDLQGSFDAARDRGLNPFQAALYALRTEFPLVDRAITGVQSAIEWIRDNMPSLSGAIDDLGSTIGSTFGAITSLLTGDFSEAWDHAVDAWDFGTDAFANLITGVIEGIQAIDWDEVVSEIKLRFKILVEAVDWGELAGGIFDFLTSKWAAAMIGGAALGTPFGPAGMIVGALIGLAFAVAIDEFGWGPLSDGIISFLTSQWTLYALGGAALGSPFGPAGMIVGALVGIAFKMYVDEVGWGAIGNGLINFLNSEWALYAGAGAALGSLFGPAGIIVGALVGISFKVYVDEVGWGELGNGIINLLNNKYAVGAGVGAAIGGTLFGPVGVVVGALVGIALMVALDNIDWGEFGDGIINLLNNKYAVGAGIGAAAGGALFGPVGMVVGAAIGIAIVISIDKIDWGPLSNGIINFLTSKWAVGMGVGAALGAPFGPGGMIVGALIGLAFTIAIDSIEWNELWDMGWDWLKSKLPQGVQDFLDGPGKPLHVELGLDFDIPEPSWPSWLTTPPQWWINVREGRWPWDNGEEFAPISLSLDYHLEQGTPLDEPGLGVPGAGSPDWYVDMDDPDYFEPILPGGGWGAEGARDTYRAVASNLGPSAVNPIYRNLREQVAMYDQLMMRQASTTPMYTGSIRTATEVDYSAVARAAATHFGAMATSGTTNFGAVQGAGVMSSATTANAWTAESLRAQLAAVANYTGLNTQSTQQFSTVQGAGVASSATTANVWTAESLRAQLAAVTNYTGLNTQSTHQFSTLAANTRSNAIGMSTSFLGHAQSMSSGGIGQATAANIGMVAQIAAAAGGVGSQSDAMAKGGVRGALNMRTGMTNETTQIAGMIAGQGVRWAATTLALAWTMRDNGATIGRQLGSGIVSGLDSMHASVASSAARLVATANNAARMAAWISSPSRYWHNEIGVMMALGAAGGLESTESVSAVTGASRRLIERANMAAMSAANMQTPGSRPGSHGAGVTVIDNSTHTKEFVALTESDFQQLLRKADRGNNFVDSWSDPDAINQYLGGR